MMIPVMLIALVVGAYVAVHKQNLSANWGNILGGYLLACVWFYCAFLFSNRIPFGYFEELLWKTAVILFVPYFVGVLVGFLIVRRISRR